MKRSGLGHSDDIIAAITHIHAAGLDAEKWPAALSCMTDLIGGHGASLEFMERPSFRHRGMYAYGLPAVGAYLEHYAPMCPRVPHAARQPAGAVIYDGQYCYDAAMDANPFFAEFLAGYDMRYSLGGVVTQSPTELVLTGVQISPRQGHPSQAKIKLMEVLLPHVQQATDVMRRLGKLSDAEATFERTLDWLMDGVVLLASDGSVRYANIAAQKIFRANDGIAIRRGALTIEAGAAAAKLGAAMKAIGRLRDASVETMVQADFMVPRRSEAASYLLSVRPLVGETAAAGDTVALLFIHDPLVRKTSGAKLLAQVFGLTTAEADVANALCLGLSPDEYARQNKISANTVYTHIRHLKDKTGSRRMAELIRKLNDVQVMVIAKREK